MDSLSYLKLGNKAFSDRDFPKALAHYQKALEEGRGDPLWMADLYGNIGNVYAATGQEGPAVKWYRKSLEILRREEAYSRLGITFVNIGNLYADQNENVKAIHYYKQGVLLLEQEGEFDGLSTLYGNLSLLYLKQSDLQSALNYAQKGMSNAKRLNRPVRIAEASHRFSKVKQALGNFQESLSLSQVAYDLFRQIPDELGMAATLFHQADLYEKAGDQQNAIVCLERVVAIDEKYQLPKLSENRSRLLKLKETFKKVKRT
jgi:tetratricopeptide (TPR) repeat protein